MLGACGNCHVVVAEELAERRRGEGVVAVVRAKAVGTKADELAAAVPAVSVMYTGRL